MTPVKTPKEIELMRESGRQLAHVLKIVASSAKPGVSTQELNDIAAKELKHLGGEPAFKGYQGFPGVLCTSVNNQIVHGMPSKQTILKEGDLIGLDFGVNYKGMITDSALTVGVGDISDENRRLLKGTEEALLAGINVLHGGVHVNDISTAVQKVMDEYKFGIVRDLVGHGVGHHLHEDPNIPNFSTGKPGPELLAGMTIAIEPMSTLGADDVHIAEDGWTVMTSDDSLSAHFEHTVLITNDGFEILTAR